MKPTLKVSDLWLRKILAVLYQRRHTTRAGIVDATGLNPASVSQALQHLMHCGVVQKQGRLPSCGGRRCDHLRLNSEAGYFVAVDLAGTRIRFGLTNFLGDIRCSWEEPVIFNRKLVMRTFVRGIQAVTGSLTAHERSRLLAMGVSYPGTINGAGRVTAVNLGWFDFPLAAKIRKVVDLPVFLSNESRTKLTAERWLGAAQNSSNCVYLMITSGVGVASIINGQVLFGRDGNAGEFGHAVIDPQARDRCNCGRRGCLEAIASSPNIVRQYLEQTGRGQGRLSGDRVTEVFEKARAGDGAALAVLDRVGRHLGLALAHLVNLLNPELILLGGDMIHGSDLLLPRIQKHLSRNTLPTLLKGVEIKFSSLGPDIGLIGAASMAFHNLLDDPELLRRICTPPAADARGAMPGANAKRIAAGWSRPG